MLTIDALKAYGADTLTGLSRCLNNEAFYLRLVKMSLADANFDRLKAALEARDYVQAFEAAHALKGSLGNLSLTPLFDPICTLTERLRGQTGLVDTDDLARIIFEQLDKARALL